MKKNISLLVLMAIALGTSGYCFFLYQEKADLATRYRNQHRELQALEARKPVLQSLKTEKNDLAEKVSVLKSSRDELQASLQDKEQTIESINQELGEKEQTVEELQLELAEKEQTVDGLKLELSEKELALEHAMDTLALKEKDKLSMEKTIRDRAARLSAALDDKEQQLAKAENARAGQKEQVDALQMALAREQVRIGHLEKRLASAQELVAKAEEARAGQKEQVEALQMALAREQVRIGHLEKRLASAQELVAKAEKARAGQKEQVAALQIALAREHGRLDRLQKNFASTRQALAETEQELVQARQSIAIQEEKIRSGEKAADRKIAEMKGEIDRLQGIARDKQSRSGVLARRLKELKDSETSLQHRVDGQQNKVDELVATMENTQKKNQSLENLVKENQQLLGELKEELSLVQQAKKDAEKRINNLKQTHKNLIAKFQKQIQQKEMTITELRGDLTVSIVDKILFPSGDSIVRSAGKDVLENVSKILQQVGSKKIRVVGHTDSIPIGPRIKYKYQSNWELSAVRAASVVHVLERYLPPENLEVVGRSFYDPLGSNETQEGKARNRRVEIVLAPQLTP